MGVFGTGVYGSGVYGGTTALTLTVQDRYPDRVLLTATGIVSGNLVTISRTVAGSTVRVPVRFADSINPASDTIIVVDAEQPFGIELTYRLTIDETADADTEIVTVTLAGGKVALSDAISGLAAEVVVLSWPNKDFVVPSTVFPVDGRNIVVSGKPSGFEGGIEVFVETNEARDAVVELIKTATSGVLQLRQAGGYDDVDAYIAVQRFTPTRFSQDGSDPRRVIGLDVVETGPWAPTLQSSTFTLGDIDAAYVGETYADLAADYATLLLIAQGDFT